MAEIDVEAPARAAAEQAAPRGRMSWRAQVAVTHLAFAHNLQSTALAIFLVPAQVALIVGDSSKDSALAAVVMAGAFVGAVVQIVAGGLSDRAAFRLGRRRLAPCAPGRRSSGRGVGTMGSSGPPRSAW